MTTWDDIFARLERWKDWNGVNEEATIIGLVLPILKLLGFDAENAEYVYPQELADKEYRQRRREDEGVAKPDILLYRESKLEGGKPWLVIEVKQLGKRFNDKDEGQIKKYARQFDVSWLVLTNGKSWRFFKTDSLSEVEQIDLSDINDVERLASLLPVFGEPSLEKAAIIAIQREVRSLFSEAQWDEIARKMSDFGFKVWPTYVEEKLSSVSLRYENKHANVEAAVERIRQELAGKFSTRGTRNEPGRIMSVTSKDKTSTIEVTSLVDAVKRFIQHLDEQDVLYFREYFASYIHQRELAKSAVQGLTLSDGTVIHVNRSNIREFLGKVREKFPGLTPVRILIIRDGIVEEEL